MNSIAIPTLYINCVCLNTSNKGEDFFFFFQAEDGIRDADVTGADVCSSDLIPRGPITAETWANKSTDVPGFKVVTNPQPGDIVAIEYRYKVATGHVAVVSDISEGKSRSEERRVGKECRERRTKDVERKRGKI